MDYLGAKGLTSKRILTFGEGTNFVNNGSSSSAVNMTIDLSSYYNIFRIIEVYFYGVIPATNNTTLQMLVSKDASAYDTAANSYQWAFSFSVSGNLGSGLSSTGSGDTSISISTGVGNTSGMQSSGRITIYNPNQTSVWPTYTWEAGIAINGGTFAVVNGSATRQTGQLTKAIRLQMSSGNITGSWAIYGLN